MLDVAVRHDLGPFRIDAQFRAPPGVTVLFGPSGAGKSTVVKAVAGLFRPDAGRIAVEGRVLLDTAAGVCLPPHRRRLGLIFQDGRLFPHLSVRGNLEYGGRFAPKDRPRESLERVVDLLGIAALLDRRPTALSGGEKQRVAIGRALLAAPEMLLADEPLAALDAARKAEILPYFERLRDEVGVPILYVSHAVSEVARLATTVVVLQDGRVAAQGPAAEVLGDPAVTPTGPRDAGALLSARVVRHHDDGLSEVQAGAAVLFLPRLDAAPGATLRLRVAAQDVMLARARPEGVSALNILPAAVTGLRAVSDTSVLVSLDTAAGRLLSRVTRRSAGMLDLETGLAVHAIVKSVAVDLGE